MLELVVMASKKNDDNDDEKSNLDQTSNQDEDIFKASESPLEFFKTPQFDEEFFKTPEFPPDLFKTPEFDEEFFKTPEFRRDLFKTPEFDEEFFKTPEFPTDFFKTLEFDEEFFKTPTSLQFFFKTSPAEPLPPPDPNLTASDVAEWMESQVMNTNYLAQDHAAYYIKGHFGDRFTFININGNLAIARDVLAEFYKRTKDTVVWCKTERYWRKTTTAR